MKFRETEFTLKDFRLTKNRKDYWFAYSDIIEGIAKHGSSALKLIAEKVFTDNGTDFVSFLTPFIEGDFTVITEAQKDENNEKDLIDFTLVVVTGFLALSNNSQ